MQKMDNVLLWMSRIRRFTRRKRFKKRYHIINYFARKRGCKTYLEIGTDTGRCLQRIECAERFGVDPNPKVERPEWNLQRMTSDDFFASTDMKFDLVFIDGLHIAEQVVRDIFNSLQALNPQGVILLHDCNPPTEEAQLRDASLAKDGTRWNGDVWKAIAYVRRFHPEILCRVVDTDEGIGVIIPADCDRLPKRSDADEQEAQTFIDGLTWHELEQNRDQLLGLVSSREELESALSEHLKRPSGQ